MDLNMNMNMNINMNINILEIKRLISDIRLSDIA
jgi:hypothetical protein